MQRPSRLRKIHVIDYPEACTGYGAIAYAGIMKDDVLMTKLKERYLPYFVSDTIQMPPVKLHVDAFACGIVPFEFAIRSGDEKWLDIGNAIANKQWEDTIPEGITGQTRWWIDDMFMVGTMQIQAFRATHNVVYLNRAAKFLVLYIEKLQQTDGLFLHAPDSPFRWGRGNGWVAVSIAEVLVSMPKNHPLRPKLLDGYKKMMAALLENQSPEGMWRQLIDNPESWPETSCTGMFAYSFMLGIKAGILDAKTYVPAVEKSWISLCGYIDKDTNVREICIGTNKGFDVPYYLNRPRQTGDLHGQAPVLWMVKAFIEKYENK
jgi:rhamnogalacturonyl hydrolase YesR